MRSFPRAGPRAAGAAEPGSVEVDAHGGHVGGERAEDRSVETADEPVPAVQPAPAGKAVVAGDQRRPPRAPAQADLDAHARVSDEVLDVGAALAMLADHPEDVSIEAVAHGCAPAPSGAPPGGLQQR